jgi:hypothetical protein
MPIKEAKALDPDMQWLINQGFTIMGTDQSFSTILSDILAGHATLHNDIILSTISGFHDCITDMKLLPSYLFKVNQQGYQSYFVWSPDYAGGAFTYGNTPYKWLLCYVGDIGKANPDLTLHEFGHEIDQFIRGTPYVTPIWPSLQPIMDSVFVAPHVYNYTDTYDDFAASFDLYTLNDRYPDLVTGTPFQQSIDPICVSRTKFFNTFIWDTNFLYPPSDWSLPPFSAFRPSMYGSIILMTIVPIAFVAVFLLALVKTGEASVESIAAIFLVSTITAIGAFVVLLILNTFIGGYT